MRLAISENVWELLIACFLLVVVLGIFGYYIHAYICQTKISRAKSVVSNIFDQIKTWKESGMPGGVITLSCANLNESGCSVTVSSEGSYEEVHIVCNNGCKYEYKINGISGINFQLDDSCRLVTIKKQGSNFEINEVSSS